MSQINIRLMMDAKIKGTVVCLWKDIQMPALPPVGCSISLVGVETDCLDVTRILWLEELQLFVVSIEDYELDEVLSGWETDPEEETWYREAITNAVRRMAADFVTLLPDADECQGCAGRGAGYCPTCKKRRYGTCGDCGKDLSEEERGQFRCELCSQYPSPEMSG